MSIADTCEESAFEHGRSVAIEGFTTSELVEELCKRKKVKHVSNQSGFWRVYYGDFRESISDSGAATILVVRE